MTITAESFFKPKPGSSILKNSSKISSKDSNPVALNNQI